MGWDPDPEEIPIEVSDLSYEAQLGLMMFNLLPDRIEGMSGTWLGKDFSCLDTFMNIYEIDNKREVLDYILVIQHTYDEHYREQQKARESRNKGRK